LCWKIILLHFFHLLLMTKKLKQKLNILFYFFGQPHCCYYFLIFHLHLKKIFLATVLVILLAKHLFLRFSFLSDHYILDHSLLWCCCFFLVVADLPFFIFFFKKSYHFSFSYVIFFVPHLILCKDLLAFIKPLLAFSITLLMQIYNSLVGLYYLIPLFFFIL
jgi:hypothetical protein